LCLQAECEQGEQGGEDGRDVVHRGNGRRQVTKV
jgi:hypothetical protein